MSSSGWIGVDLDGTLAVYPGTFGVPHGIGEPVPLMVNRVKRWLDQGEDVRIFTARAAGPFTDVLGREVSEDYILAEVREWCEKHVGRQLPITCKKDYNMIQLWDDRAVQVIPNTGKRVDGLSE